MNWTLQLLSHSLGFLLHIISLGNHISIPLLNTHLKARFPSQSPRAFLIFSLSSYMQLPNSPFFRALLPLLKFALYLLDRVQSKAIRLVNNPNLTKSLQPLSHRHLVGDLIFCRYFHGHCSQEIREIIHSCRATRSSTHSLPFQVSLPIHELSPTNNHLSQEC